MSKNGNSRAYWEKMVDEFEQSGEVREVFAKKHGVKPHSFYYWLYLIRKERKAGKKPSNESAFVQISVEAKPKTKGALRLELAGGASLVFEQVPCVDFISAMVKALD